MGVTLMKRFESARDRLTISPYCFTIWLGMLVRVIIRKSRPYLPRNIFRNCRPVGGWETFVNSGMKPINLSSVFRSPALQTQKNGVQLSIQQALKNPPSGLNNQLAAVEKNLIAQELTRNKGDIKRTYTNLGLSRQTLYNRLKALGLKRKYFI